jgi:hypothetical protein
MSEAKDEGLLGMKMYNQLTTRPRVHKSIKSFIMSSLGGGMESSLGIMGCEVVE